MQAAIGSWSCVFSLSRHHRIRSFLVFVALWRVFFQEYGGGLRKQLLEAGRVCSQCQRHHRIRSFLVFVALSGEFSFWNMEEGCASGCLLLTTQLYQRTGFQDRAYRKASGGKLDKTG